MCLEVYIVMMSERRGVISIILIFLENRLVSGRIALVRATKQVEHFEKRAGGGRCIDGLGNGAQDRQ